MKYFAYGSNMNEEDVERWCRKESRELIELRSPKVAILQDYALAWNYYSATRKGGAANIIASPGSHVEGILFELSEDHFDLIALKEGSPNYYRPLKVKVKLRDGGTIDRVVTYSVREELLRRTFVPPSRDYLKIVIEGAQTHGLSSDWIEKLRAIQTSDSL